MCDSVIQYVCCVHEVQLPSLKKKKGKPQTVLTYPPSHTYCEIPTRDSSTNTLDAALSCGQEEVTISDNQ